MKLLKYIINIVVSLLVVFLFDMQIALIDRFPTGNDLDLWKWFLNVNSESFKIAIVVFLLLLMGNYFFSKKVQKENKKTENLLIAIIDFLIIIIGIYLCYKSLNSF